MNIIDQIVEVLERDDYNISYFYRKNILFGEVKNRPEDDDDIIGIRGVGNAPYPFPLAEIKIDFRNGKIEAYREGSLFMESNINDYIMNDYIGMTNPMESFMTDLDNKGFNDPFN